MSTPQKRESDVTAKSKRILVAIAALALVLAMMHVLNQYDLLGGGGSGLPENFQYDQSDQRKISPDLLQYRQVRSVDIGLEDPRDLAVGPEGNWYVVGDSAVRVLDPNGTLLNQWSVAGQPRCIDVSNDGTTLALGVGAKVVLLDAEGNVRADWPEIRRGGTICGIDIDKDSNSIYVAEYVARRVYRYSLDGERLTVLGNKDEEGYSGLKSPSPYISVNLGRDLVWINNPGQLRVEAHSPRGEFQHAWGTASQMDITGFPGCCNPCDFAILPDGRFVTFEKGKNYETVKVFQKEGILDAVVVPPDAFQPDTRGVAVAVAKSGELLVMDPARRTIRVFQQKESQDTP